MTRPPRARPRGQRVAVAVLAASTLAVSLTAAATVSTSLFPYTRCLDYRATSSPYFLQVLSTSGNATMSSTTFVLRHVNTPPLGTPSTCYTVLERDGVDKILVDTKLECMGKVRVYINGKYAPTCRVQPAAHVPNAAFIGVIAKPPFKHDGDTITIVGSGTCANASILFNQDAQFGFRYSMLNHRRGQGAPCCPTDGDDLPPNGGPPPSGSFPWCDCRTATAGTPWYIKSVMHTAVTGTSSSSNEYAFTFGRRGCKVSASAPCCDMDLSKLEVNIGDACKHSLGNASIHVHRPGAADAVRRVNVGYTSYGKDALVAKFTGLGLTGADANNSTLRFSLRKGAACPTLNMLLAQPMYALFGRGTSCCPAWTFDGALLRGV